MNNTIPSLDELYKSIHPDNIMGEGFFSIAYKIPTHPDLVFKAFKHGPLRDLSHNDFLQLQIKGRNEVVDTINYGQTIAEVGEIGSVGIKVPGDVIAHRAYADPEIDTRNYINKLFLISKLPLETYEMFCKDVKHLTHKGMGIDALEWNTLIDVSQNRFHMVDVEPYERCAEPVDNGISGIASVCVLARKSHLYYNLSNADKVKARQCTRTILHKVIQAGQKQQLGMHRNDGAGMNVQDIRQTMVTLGFTEKAQKLFLSNLCGYVCSHRSNVDLNRINEHIRS